MLPGLCAAQANQFQNLPDVRITGGRVGSFLPGVLQSPQSLTDLLWVNAAVGSGVTSSVTVGEELNQGGPGFFNGGENHIVFTSVANVAAALADFDGDGKTDFAFALTPAVAGTTNLCVYYGSGATVAQAETGVSSYAGPASSPANAYPPIGGKNGCMTFATTGSKAPYFSQIVAFPLKTASPLPGLLIEDSANNVVYVFSNTGFDGVNGALAGFKLIGTAITLASADGAGPISIGDFNNDGNTDFIVNGQASNTATVYLGNGDGTFSATPIRYTFDHHVHSLLLHDMNHDGIQDMVVEGDAGVIEIFPGTGATANPFSMPNIGGTIGIGSPVGIPDGFSGTGGHLAVIDPNTLDILTTTPIGLSVLQPLTGGLFYQLKAIYNIGPGRTSFALADLYDTGLLDLAVDSAEGVAIFRADTNRDGGFQASNAYAALAPALGSVVGRFRNTASNPNGYLDVVVNTGATQAQLLTGIGGGAFNTFPAPANTSGGPGGVLPNLWSNLISGDFNGDGIPDIAYSLTGSLPPLPLPSSTGPGLYVQYGIGNGTFAAPIAISPSSVGAPTGNLLYGESTVGDFNGDNIADIANIDTGYADTLLGQTTNSFKLGFNATASYTPFNQVAAGFFKLNRTSQQDLIVQQGVNFIPYKNAQDGTGAHFTAMPSLVGAAPPLYPSTVLLTDVDRDGNGDLVVVYYNSEYNSVGAGPVAPNDLYIWWGNGDGTFSATPQVMTLSRNDYLGTVADMNGDGLPDLVLSDGSLVTILYNQGAVSTPPNRTFAGEQHFLAGQGINSLSLLPLAGNSSPSLVVANGGATISNALALGGGTASSLSLTPNPDVNTGGITVLINNITTQPVTGTLTASPDPSPFGDAFTLTAILTPSPGGAAPTGTVQFSMDGATVGAPVTVVAGSGSSTASYTVAAGNTYPGGIHTLTAVYSGDSVNSPATLTGTENIAGGATTTQIFMCIGPVPTTCPAPPGAPSPFPLYSASLPMYYGQIWNGYIQATANDGSVLTGNLELIDTYTGLDVPPPNPLCSLVLGVTPACPNSVGTTQGTSVGLNLLTGYYPGDATHTGSTSNPTAITVLQDLTSQPALTGSPPTSPAGDPVTFTATLTGNFAAPTGTVTFSQVGVATPIGTGTFAPGSGFTSSATFTTSSLPIGNDSITASYAATTDFAGATFPTIVETITPSLNGTFTLTATPNPVTIGVGYGAILTVTVTPQNAFSQGVNLTCSNLPAEATCTFLNPSIAAGGGSTSLVVQTTSPHTCGTTTPYFYGSAGKGPLAPFALPALAGLVLLFVPGRAGRRRWLRALLAVAAVAAVAQISGCSTCTDLGTRPATYTFQVTGTAANSPTTQSQPVTMTVTI
jgi:hypothetical protein